MHCRDKIHRGTYILMLSRGRKTLAKSSYLFIRLLGL